MTPNVSEMLRDRLFLNSECSSDAAATVNAGHCVGWHDRLALLTKVGVLAYQLRDCKHTHQHGLDASHPARMLCVCH